MTMSIPNAVEVINAIKIYETALDKRKVSALQGCDLKVAPGELISIIGPSGAGKTTLLRIISGIEGLSSGEVKIGGNSLNKWSNRLRQEFRRKYIGTFTQYGRDNFDLKMTVREAIRWELSQAGWTMKAGIERTEELLNKLDMVILGDQKCGNLSAGEAMRVSLIKAVAKKPFIVLADEPTGQLDSDNIIKLYSLMRQVIKEETSIIVATHDVRFQSLSDRTLLMLDGRLASEQEVEELLRKRTPLLDKQYMDDPSVSSKLLVDNTSSIRLPQNILRRLDINEKIIISHDHNQDFAILKRSDDDTKGEIEESEIKGYVKFSRKNVLDNIIIEINNLSKNYVTHDYVNEVLDDLNFKIKEGEFVVILGPSGTGKTTLLNILSGLETPLQGSVYVDGISMNDDSNDKKKVQLHSISYLTQNYTVHPYLTVYENAILPLILKGNKKPEDLESINYYFNNLGLEDYQDNYPTELSGGQQQRSSLIASLVKDTKIILADEPTANLDGQLSAEVMNILTDFAENGKTIIIATHDLMTVKQGYRVIQLQDKRIINDQIADEAFVIKLQKEYMVHS